MRTPVAAFLIALAFAAPAAHAESMSAGVREIYITPHDLDFNSDGMNRVKADAFNAGMTTLTAHLRLGMASATDSYVFTPALRSSRVALETLAARVAHGNGQLVLKPIIGLNPDLGIIQRLTGINPADPQLWFATYQQAMQVPILVAANHEVAELVVGTGLTRLWSSSLSDNWIALLQDARRRISPHAMLSIELSSDADIAAMELWQRQDPDKFAQIASLLNVIRVSSEPRENNIGEGFNASLIQQQLNARLRRVRAVFPTQLLTLANVVIPACRQRSYDEDEVTCAPGAPWDLKYQADGVDAFLTAEQGLSSDLRSGIRDIEFLAATTDNEPDLDKVDYRFMLYNQQVKDLLAKKKVSSPLAVRPIVPRPPSVGTGPLACIYYDQFDDKDKMGIMHSKMLANLIGAFPRWRYERRSVKDYKQGDLFGCEVTFYIASHFFLKPPAEFFTDAAVFAHDRQLVWMNYKFSAFQFYYDQVSQQFGSPKLGFNVPYVMQPQSDPSPTNQDPGFFRYFDYKGETFEKLARWDMISNIYMSDPTLSLVRITDPTHTEQIATARHSKQADLTSPYIVRQREGDAGGVWYVADDPFSFVHYEDRYMIFCDILWDVLREQAPTGPKMALVRMEDVNPTQNQDNLRWAVDYLASRGVPFSMAVIPYYSNLFGDGMSGTNPTWKPAYQYPEFVGTLRYAKARGANFVWHGVAHQAGDLVGGFDGMSAADFEFWLYPQNQPLPQDSSDYLLNLLEKGEDVWQRLGIHPVAWELPHYAASALDNYLFGKLFQWNYHRTLYFKENLVQDAQLDPKHRFFDCVTDACREERRQIARQLKVDADYSTFAGQISPYIIYKDVYGQAMIPETVGMVEYPFYNDETTRMVAHPADIVRRAKKLRVIRGAMASFFWHVDLINPEIRYYQKHPGNYDTEGGYNTLKIMVEGIQALGYKFVSIGDCNLFPQENCTSSFK